MKNTILSLLAAISVASCSPYSSGKSQEVQNSLGITCENILSGRVSDDQVRNFVVHQKWSSGQKLIALYEIENILKNIDPRDPLSLDGFSILERHYAEIRELEKTRKELSQEEQAAIHDRHLVDLLGLLLKYPQGTFLFPECLHPIKKLMT